MMESRINSNIVLKLKSQDGGPESLGAILDLVEPLTGNLGWSIQHLDMIGSIYGVPSIPDFQKQIVESTKGHVCGMKELRALQTGAEQIIEIFVVGAPASLEFRRFKSYAGAYEYYPVVLDRDDDGLWRIACQSRDLAAAIESKLGASRG